MSRVTCRVGMLRLRLNFASRSSVLAQHDISRVSDVSLFQWQRVLSKKSQELDEGVPRAPDRRSRREQNRKALPPSLLPRYAPDRSACEIPKGRQVGDLFIARTNPFACS